MQRLPLVLAGAILSTGLLARPGISQDRMPQSSADLSDEEKQVQAILAAKDPQDAASGYTALFSSGTVCDVLFKWATVARLRRLQTNPSDSIAIQAAWQQVELTVPFFEPTHAVRPDRNKLSWFLGFLEKRARVKTPQWWAEAVLDAQANRRGNVYAGQIEATPPEAIFDKQEGKPVIRLGSGCVPIPAGLQDKLGRNGIDHNVSVLITPLRCYVAVYNDFGQPYRLACVERSSATVRWVADVWGSYWHAVAGFSCNHWVEVREQGDRVLVFGIAGAFHVEAFRIDDGVNVLRFSNSYSTR